MSTAKKKRIDWTKAIPSPLKTLEVALSLAAIGWPVFPVALEPTERGTRKTPAVKWLEGATVDADTIRRWWTRWPKAWIGVHAARAGLLIVDLDVPKNGDGRDGRDELRRRHLPLPPTFRYATRSGGQHHLYAAPTGLDLGITQDDPAPGIDLRAGHGLCVYYGPALDALPTLTEAPAWAVDAARRDLRRQRAADRGTGIDVEEWTARLVDGKADAEVKAARDAVTREGMDHATMLGAVTRLVRAGAEGRPGVAKALATARETYVSDWPDHAPSWDAAVEGSVRHLGPPPATFEVTKAEKKALAKKESARTTAAEKRREARDLDLAATEHPDAGHRDLGDGPLAEEVADRLRGAWAWSKTLGLIRYRGHVWRQADESVLFEHVRLHVKVIARVELAYAIDRNDRKHADAVAMLASRSRVAAIGRTVVGILANAEVLTDDHADLLNTPTGVVDLRTGDLLAHDPALYFTKTTTSVYDPAAVDDDWTKALEALPPKVAAWLRVRFGQALTGHTPDDAVMPILRGGGGNGKSTILDAVRGAAGDYAVTVSDRLLLASPNDHPTELTQLMGARIAIVEELPEGRNLNVKRVKDVMGTATLSARQMRKDNVEWKATHALFVSTNYHPIVSETDRGTWRRLALVDFPYTYVEPGEPIKRAHERRADPNIVKRLQRPNAAVLAWMVAGAAEWYAASRTLPRRPKRVRIDTADWRMDADPVFAYVRDRLELSEGNAVATTDLVRDFNEYLETRQQRPWSEQTIAQRFQGHALLPGVERQRVRFGGEWMPSRPPLAVRSLPMTTQAWCGIAFRLPEATLPAPSPEVFAMGSSS